MCEKPYGKRGNPVDWAWEQIKARGDQLKPLDRLALLAMAADASEKLWSADGYNGFTLTEIERVAGAWLGPLGLNTRRWAGLVYLVSTAGQTVTYRIAEEAFETDNTSGLT